MLACPCSQKLFNLAEVSSLSLFNGFFIAFQAWWVQPGHLCECIYHRVAAGLACPSTSWAMGSHFVKWHCYVVFMGSSLCKGKTEAPFVSFVFSRAWNNTTGYGHKRDVMKAIYNFCKIFFLSVGAWFMVAQKWGCRIGDADISTNTTLTDKITNQRGSFKEHFLSPSVCETLLDALGV